MLGAALSFAPTSRGLLGYMRTFATLAAVAVVITHLLPEALHELGPLSILLFLAGWFAPALAHFIGQRSTHGRSANAILEAGYWGLVAHHVADGIGLGTYTRLPPESGSHFDVIVALAAHTVPLIAVVSLAYRVTFGARSALIRSLGLAFASVVGILLSSLVEGATLEHYAPIVAAVAAGLLLHVVTHDLTEDPPRRALARTIDLAVALLGVGVSWLGLQKDADPATWAFADRFVGLAERSALVILVGLAAAALSLRVSDRASKLGRAMLPAGVLGSDGLLLGVALFGFSSTAVRVLVGCLVLTLLPLPADEDEHTPSGFLARVSAVLTQTGPWLLLGGVIGALLLAVPPGALNRHLAGTPLELALLALVSNVTPVALPAALLIATGLSGVGISDAGVLLFTLLGPLMVRRNFGWRERSALTLFCVAVAWISQRFHVFSAPLDGALSASAPGARIALALGVLLGLGVWQVGARVWLSVIVQPPAHEHEHAHDVHGPHDDGHAPGHGH